MRMDILEVLEQVRELLQQKGRITYRILKRQFALDDEALEDLKEELLFSHPEITEVDGRGLAWAGDTQAPATPSSSQLQPQTPASVALPERFSLRTTCDCEREQRQRIALDFRSPNPRLHVIQRGR